MIICFNCPPRTKQALDTLIEHDQYRDYAEAISAAVMNLVVLQGELSSTGVVVIDSDEPNPSDTIMRSVKNKGRLQEPYRRFDSLKDESSKLPALRTERSVHIPNLFRLGSVCDLPPQLASLPEDNQSSEEEVTLDRWIFGQYNKLLPAKASVRALKNL